ncbi:MAG: VWA domain-containing protein [Lachnospiraceae bacterium]|nr:VWA domain-containing protein [Lachnospiraceae bacterium]
MFCSQCGKEIKEYARFCPFCGQAVNIPAADRDMGAPASREGQAKAHDDLTKGLSQAPSDDQDDNDRTVRLKKPLSSAADSPPSPNESGQSQMPFTPGFQDPEQYSNKKKRDTARRIHENMDNTNQFNPEPPKKSNVLPITLTILIAILLIFLAIMTGMFIVGSGGFTEAMHVIQKDGFTGIVDVITGHYDGQALSEGEDGDLDSNDSESESQSRLAKKEGEPEMEDQAEDTPAEEAAPAGDVADSDDPSRGSVSFGKDEKPPYTGPKTPVDINVRQVDNTSFPKITFYANVTDKQGNSIQNLKESDFNVQEIEGDGSLVDIDVEKIYQVMDKGRVNVNMVMDKSGSMDGYRMENAKNAAVTFLDKIKERDKVEIISFDDYVYLEQNFTENITLAANAIYNMVPNGSTALYDALYSGIYDTYYQDGAKCVIGFTDGIENASSHTFNEVVALSQETGIPVFIIGVGEAYDSSILRDMANECSGEYYSVEESDMEDIMEDIYSTIYREQQDYYVFEYTSPKETDVQSERTIVLKTSESSEFTGEYRKPFVPQADMTNGFSSDYASVDYMIPDSSSRAITEADLARFSLAQLRIARNEIFARHGRQFNDSYLNKWFYSKQWYLEIPTKYAPDYFDKNQPNRLSKLETANVNFILEYEKNRMANSDIFPNADSVQLSDYDVALSKDVLKLAMTQMERLNHTSILMENMQKVQNIIDTPDVTY